jgi:hypothetical protein
MKAMFSPEELRHAKLVRPFAFTKGVPVLRKAGSAMSNPYAFGTLLFDLATDPQQLRPLIDDGLEARMVGLMLDLMRANDAPAAQFKRLGLPKRGTARASHLQVRRQWPQVEATRTPVRREDYPEGPLSVHTPLQDLLADDAARPLIEELAPGLTRSPIRGIAGTLSLVEIAAFAVGPLPRALLEQLSDRLLALAVEPDGKRVHAAGRQQTTRHRLGIHDHMLRVRSALHLAYRRPVEGSGRPAFFGRLRGRRTDRSPGCGESRTTPPQGGAAGGGAPS